MINESEYRALGIQHHCEHKDLPLGPKHNEEKTCHFSTCGKAYKPIQLFKMHTETHVFSKPI